MEVQLKVKVESTLKDEATSKAKAEGKTMKQVVEELLTLYVRGAEQEEVSTTPPASLLTAEQFASHLEYVDYLERMGRIY